MPQSPATPSTLQIDQAVYGSQASALKRGYHVLAKSPGVSAETVTQLNRWCPSHGSLLDTGPDAWSLNFHPIGFERFALSRTVYGEREFSNRGGLQVVTMVLLLNQSQLSVYDNNPFAIARIARSWGGLRWIPAYPATLPRVILPCAAASETTRAVSPNGPNLHNISTAIKAVIAGKAVALTSSRPSIDMLEAVFLRVDSPRRLEFSFTSGLKPSVQRPFRLHLIGEANSGLLRTSFQDLSVVHV